MKNTKKLVGLLLALVMVFAMSAAVFAQTETVGDGSGTITISNAAKGETYTIYKLFDATVTGTAGGSIAYTGTIPESLKAYFTADAKGNISATGAAWKTTGDTKEMSEGLHTALTEWAKTATATASVESNGSTLTFEKLPYGYYVVKTTQGGQAISVDSTNPTVNIVDKNSTTPNNLTKSVDDDDVFIGQTVTYTVTFKTSNYNGAGTAAKKIVTYTIEDTLPEFLDNVTVTSITVDNDANTTTTDDQVEIKNGDTVPQFVDKKIELDWYDETNGRFLYDNGALVTITYTAVVTDKAAIDGDGNTNKVTLTWTVEGGEKDKPLEAEETIFTYAIALKKVDDKGKPLAGAVFQFPFYVKATADADGAYIHAGNTSGEGLTNQITTPADGVIVVKGVASGTYSITEVTAPNGYNKLLAPVSVTAVKTGKTTTHTTIHLDENGNIVETDTETKVEVILNDIAAATIVVVNKTGAELPSTGGIGTTIFYVAGGVLVIGSAALLIAKRKKA